MKIILNRNFGGFQISHKAIRLLIAAGRHGESALDVEHCNDIPDYAYEMSDYHYDSCGVYYDGKFYTTNVEEARYNQELVSLIETYGSFFVSGIDSKLEVVDFDLESRINCFDGRESLF